MYAELHCLSNFSFLRGASRPEELVAQAAKLHYKAIAITDECSLAGIVKAHVAARDHNIKLIVGCEFKLKENFKFVLLAPNRIAYEQLCALISRSRRRAEKGHYLLQERDLKNHTNQLLAIWLPQVDQQAYQPPVEQGQYLHSCFEQRLWLGVTQLLTGNDHEQYHRCHQLAVTLDIPMLACGNVHMHSRQRKPLQDVLTAIRLNHPVSSLGRRLQGNSERYLRDITELNKRYPQALLQESCLVAERCQFSLEELRYEYPKELVPQGLSASEYLRQLVLSGTQKRWPEGVSPAINQQIEHELALIQELAYEYYFLTVFDIVYFARSNNILCQGRGSAANSVVCYCLFITEVSPEHTQLLFERFISRERKEPPDIDVDFEHERREEVIQYIYKKYGRDHAALAATIITYRPRSAIRDVGKALGLDPLFIDQLAKSLAWWDRMGDLEQRFREAKLGDTDLAWRFMTMIHEILGFPRHLSQHVGGFIITAKPLHTLVPIENAAMDGRTIIQWDKEDIASLGLLKIDILALGMLSAIRKCFSLIEKHYQTPINLASVPQGDPRTYAMLCRGDSLGVFQVESRAQMSMLPRLKPRSFYDLVIEVAIVRPGPIQGDMVHPYLRRRQGEEAVSYPNADVKAVLERTLGVPIFQEQVIKLAMVAAGFSGGEADQLRRAMASWGRNTSLMSFKEKLINGMVARGHSNDFAERLFRQIQGFGSYGFPESHAASFALLVYVSAWLKCHYPAAFYCALLNSQPMGFYSPSQIIQDARRHKVSVNAIDSDISQWDHTLEDHPDINAEPNPALRVGLRLAKGFNRAAALRLCEARQNKPFNNLRDLAMRAQLNRQEIQALVSANATERLTRNRHQGHWQRQALENHKPLLAEQEAHYSRQLDDGIELAAPSEFNDMVADYNSTGLTLKRHPLSQLRDSPALKGCTLARELSNISHGRFVRIAGLVTGRQRPGSASGVIFMTLEDDTGNINVIVWKSTQELYRRQLMGGKLLMIYGTAEHKDGVTHIIAGRIVDQSQLLEEAQLKSRDFH
ncbi:MAG: error-prone DNA polymerase [Pseudomonadales bacterium]